MFVHHRSATCRAIPALMLIVALLLSLAMPAMAEYPERDIQGIAASSNTDSKR